MGKQAIVAATGLLLLAGGSLWVVTRDADDVSGPRGPVAAGPAGLPEGGPGNAPGLASAGRRPSPSIGTAPTDAAAATSATTGALDIEVVSSTGTPLADEGVWVTFDDEELSLRTDTRGHARRSDLRPGPVTLQAARGGSKASLEVDAGTITRTRLAIPRGVAVVGVVVDPDDAPVPLAEIWLERRLSTDPPAARIGRADADGRLRLDDVPEHARISARARGRAPSGARNVMVVAGQTDQVKLRIGGPSATVRGTVTGADGKPVANARVYVGPPFATPTPMPDGGHGTEPPGIGVRTEHGGSFVAEPVAAGATFVTVRATGHGPVRRAVHLVAGANDVDVTLPPSTFVEGRVLRPDGAPAVRADVVYGASPDAMWQWWTETDADGRFRLVDLPPKDGPASTLGISHSTGTATGGLGAAWPADGTFRLVSRRRIRVRVEDGAGQPLAYRVVTAGGPDAPTGRVSATTGADGRANLEMEDDGEVDVNLRPEHGDAFQPTATRRGVRPGPEEVVLVERPEDRPSVLLTGRVIAPTGLPDATRAYAMRVGDVVGVNLSVDVRTGTISGPPVAEGTYDVSLDAVGYGTVPMGRVRVARGRTADLGDVTLRPPGRAIVTVRGERATTMAQLGVRAIGPRGTVWAFANTAGAEPTVSFDLLQPGRWEIVVGGWPFDAPVVGAASVPVEVSSGSTSVVDLTLRRGHVRTLRVTGREVGSSAGWWVSVGPEGGRVPLESRVFGSARGQDPRSLDVALTPGRYVADAETGDGRRVSVPFEVRGDGEPPVELDLSR